MMRMWHRQPDWNWKAEGAAIAAARARSALLFADAKTRERPQARVRNIDRRQSVGRMPTRWRPIGGAGPAANAPLGDSNLPARRGDALPECVAAVAHLRTAIS